MTRTYTEMIKLKTFEERFKYLKLDGRVGSRTFGSNRYLNQALYKSKEWLNLKSKLIVRDNGCDLAMPDYDIFDRIYLHHINPISKEDIIDRARKVLSPDNLVCVSFSTHEAIHYGTNDFTLSFKEREPGDTKLW